MSTILPTATILDAFSALRRELAISRSTLLKTSDLNHIEVSILYRLTLSSATMGEISEYVVADKASVTRAIAGLEAGHLVSRTLDPNDRRISIVELTAKGKIKARKSIAFRELLGAQVNETLNANDQKELIRLLTKVAAQLQENRK